MERNNKQMNEPKNIGQGLDRIDGLLKVTGTANYATDYKIKNAVYGVIFKSTIAAGEIEAIDVSQAEQQAGVLKIITHQNAPQLNVKGGIRGGALLQGPKIEFYGQHIGVVVAETFEQARYAAHLVKVTYKPGDARVDFDKLSKEGVLPKEKDKADKRRGDVDAAMSTGEVTVDAVYETPIEHHQPMEPHATIAVWEGD